MVFKYESITKGLSAASLGWVVTMGGCAPKPPAPDVAALAEPSKKAMPAAARAKPKSDCHLAQVNLPAPRKLALFEQFAAEEGASAPVSAGPPRAPPACAPAAK